MAAHSRPIAVDAIVPVHGGWQHAKRCIQSLLAQDDPCNIIIVDDLSPDDTAARIEEEFPDLTLLRNEVNRGFAATCNAGIRAGHGDLVVLVNSDVIVNPTFTTELKAVANARTQERVGSFTTLLLDTEGRVDSFGIVADMTGAGFVRYHGADADRAHATEPPVLGPYGALAAYRREALDEVGLLDEAIFMYGEELDLALRLRSAGWDTAVVNGVSGQHVGGASAGKGSARQRYLAGFGRGYLLRAWGVLRSRLALRAVATEVGVCALQLLRNRDVAALRGRLAGWRAASGVKRGRLPAGALDARIGLIRSLQMRKPSFWQS